MRFLALAFFAIVCFSAQDAYSQSPPTTLVLRFNGVFVGNLAGCSTIAGTALNCVKDTKKAPSGCDRWIGVGPLGLYVEVQVGQFGRTDPITGVVQEGTRYSATICQQLTQIVIATGSTEVLGSTPGYSASGALIEVDKGVNCKAKLPAQFVIDQF